MWTDHDRLAHKLMHDLIPGGPGLNGTTPADCGPEYAPHLQRLVGIYQAGGDVRGEIERFIDICPRLYELYCGDPEPEPVFKPLSFTDLMAMPEKEWLINKVLGKGDLAMIFGEAGSGKTFVTIDLIFAVVLGERWADSFDVPEPLNVAYCAGEGISGLKARFAAQFNKRSVNENMLDEHLTVYTEAPQLFESEVAETIDQFISEHTARNAGSLDLLVLDTLHAHSYGAEENSAKDTGQIIAAAKRAIKELGCAVLLVHHANKSGGYRGSSALHGSCDLIIEVKKDRDTNGFEMTCYKLKDTEPFLPIFFDLKSELHSQSVYPAWQPLKEVERSKKPQIKDKILAFLSEYPGNSFTAKQIGESIGVSQQVANKWLVEVFENGQVGRSLMYPHKNSSNRNPFIYSRIEAKQEVLNLDY